MNRRDRRRAQREIKKAIKSGVGVNVALAGYRVIDKDGAVKYAAGRQPAERGASSDTE